MRAPAEVRLERLQKLMHRVSYESERGGIIVVEGVRNRDSLRKMGISGRILCLQSSRKNTVEFAEELGGVGDIIVLTDFDREGVFLAKRLARILNAQGVHANLVLWRDLRRLIRSDIRSIEELLGFYQRLHTTQPLRFSILDRGYEAPVVSSYRKSSDDRRLRLSKEHGSLKTWKAD
jgi:5S rRNA maturation endonuclease (ribonuclease M5)